MKSFLKISEIFAQLFNVGVFEGQKEIEPELLHEMDAVKGTVVELPDDRLEYAERIRDVVKVSGLNVSFRIIFGIEEQTDIHYYMPVRDMLLDALSYDSQCRQIAASAKERNRIARYSDGVPQGTKIMPVVSLILYVGAKVWDGPRQLYDMFDTESLKGIVARHRETWYAIGAVKQDDRYVEYINTVTEQELERGVNMDVTLDYIEAKGIEKGLAQGMETGIDVVSRLHRLLASDGRLAEWDEALNDKALMWGLLREYSLVEL